MTHEQKPESAEFRTREEQTDALARAIGPEKIFSLLNQSYREEITARASSHILEAEARGAADQRRKDAEGVEPVKVEVHTEWFGWCEIPMDHFEESEHPKRLLFTRPANVAALEDRVKELEGELGALLDWADGQWCPHDNTHRGGSIWTICNDCGRKWADDVKPFDPDEDFEPSAIKQARAAIREGGEHG